MIEPEDDSMSEFPSGSLTRVPWLGVLAGIFQAAALLGTRAIYNLLISLYGTYGLAVETALPLALVGLLIFFWLITIIGYYSDGMRDGILNFLVSLAIFTIVYLLGLNSFDLSGQDVAVFFVVFTVQVILFFIFGFGAVAISSWMSERFESRMSVRVDARFGSLGLLIAIAALVPAFWQYSWSDSTSLSILLFTLSGLLILLAIMHGGTTQPNTGGMLTIGSFLTAGYLGFGLLVSLARFPVLWLGLIACLALGFSCFTRSSGVDKRGIRPLDPISHNAG